MKTPVLVEVHRSLGARLGEFAGWMLPIDYGSVIREVTSVRTAAGIFDVSHMGRIDVWGELSTVVLQSLLTNDVSILNDGAGQYALMCRPDGGIIEDLILYRRSEDSYLLIVNASNLEKVKDWIRNQASDTIGTTDCTSTTCMYALQGPNAASIMVSAGASDVSSLRRFHFQETELAGSVLLAARSGYTGEDGFEIICRADAAESVWSSIFQAGGQYGLLPCGLAARDVLRIEAGLPLYGHEIDENRTPVEAGLMRFVKMDKGEFVGRSAILERLEQGASERLVGIEMEGRAVPRDGSSISSAHGEGVVTSGTYSPTLGRGIAMAYMPYAISENEQVEVTVHFATKPGRVSKLPFYSRKK